MGEQDPWNIRHHIGKKGRTPVCHSDAAEMGAGPIRVIRDADLTDRLLFVLATRQRHSQVQGIFPPLDGGTVAPGALLVGLELFEHQVARLVRTREIHDGGKVLEAGENEVHACEGSPPRVRQTNISVRAKWNDASRAAFSSESEP